MKQKLFCLFFFATFLCLAQDSTNIWNGLYVNYGNNLKEENKEKQMVNSFEELYIIDKNGNDYFFYHRSNYKNEKERYGGGIWGNMVIKDKNIYEYCLSSEAAMVFSINRVGESFSFEDYSGPGEVGFIYEKLFPLANE